MSLSIKETDRDKLWTVGILDAAGWTALRDCASPDEAMAWMSYLNGGVHPNEIEGYWNKTYWRDNAEKAMR